MSLPVYPKAICFLWWLMDLAESAPSLCLSWVFPENPQKISLNRISWKANAYFSLNMGILFTARKVRLAKTLLRAARFCVRGIFDYGNCIICSSSFIDYVLINPPANGKCILWSAISEILNLAYINLAHRLDLWTHLSIHITMEGEKLPHFWCGPAAAKRGIQSPVAVMLMRPNMGSFFFGSRRGLYINTWLDVSVVCVFLNIFTHPWSRHRCLQGAWIS